MHEPFLEATSLEGSDRIREYALAWLERLDYSGKLERDWPPAEVGALLWERIARDFAGLWDGPIADNPVLAEVIAVSMVEDYYAAYPDPRASRYSVAGPLTDAGFRRCVLDFVHDLEEFEPDELTTRPEAAAELFWSDVHANPKRWGYSLQRGAFVDDEPRARAVAVETIRDYFALKQRAEELRAEQGGS